MSHAAGRGWHHQDMAEQTLACCATRGTDDVLVVAPVMAVEVPWWYLGFGSMRMGVMLVHFACIISKSLRQMRWLIPHFHDGPFGSCHCGAVVMR